MNTWEQRAADDRAELMRQQQAGRSRCIDCDWMNTVNGTMGDLLAHQQTSGHRGFRGVSRLPPDLADCSESGKAVD